MMSNVKKKFDTLKLFNILLMAFLLIGAWFPTVNITANAIIASKSYSAGGFMNFALMDDATGEFLVASMLPILVDILCIIGFVLCGLNKKVGQRINAILIIISTIVAGVLTKNSIFPMMKGAVSGGDELESLVGSLVLDYAADSNILGTSYTFVFYVQIIMCLLLIIFAFMWKPEDLYVSEQESDEGIIPEDDGARYQEIDSQESYLSDLPEDHSGPIEFQDMDSFQTEPAQCSTVTYGRIQGISGEYVNKAYRVMPDAPIVIGRDKTQATLLMSDSKISRKHVTIAFNSATNSYIVTDHSSYGVFNVDTGARLVKEQPTSMPAGTRLQLSDSAQMFILLDSKTKFM